MARILLADDDPVLLEVVRYKLEGLGHAVRAAPNGISALSFARAHLPNLIILDHMMPLLSGIEVVDELQNCTDTRDIPIVMLTACADHANVITALRAGVTDYITKPFALAELVVRIDLALEKNGNSRAAQ